MNKLSDENQKIADTVSRRVRVGRDPMVSGWQEILTDIMTRMKHFMISGRLATLKTLLENESESSKVLLNSVSVPDGVLSLYLPHRVRHQMRYANHGPDAQIAIDHDPRDAPDTGVVRAGTENDFSVILNALFAYPPILAAVEVYERGRMIGGDF